MIYNIVTDGNKFNFYLGKQNDLVYIMDGDMGVKMFNN